MPIFEFRCIQCGNVFEKIFLKSDETFIMECPECKSQSLERVVSRTNHVMARGAGEKPTLTTRSCGSGSSCMTLDIPGPTK
ncbi:MAG: zinc ribbon domain-containing protein [Deltaproteobacteria bacterium]|nr:zinc ribbon domain-containing protein [Deltaproteobacteria bacterium]